MPWIFNHFSFLRNDQLKIWQEMFTSIGDALQVQRANDPNYGIEKLNGNFGPSDYVPSLDYILTGICGPPGSGAFCRP
jgi:hypothetical protein